MSAGDVRRTAWLDAGQDLLREGGVSAVKLAELTHRLRRTTGSFYHHFRGMEQYRDELAAYFGDVQPRAVLHRLAPLSPRDRLLGLHEVFVAAHGRLARSFPARRPLLPLDRIYLRNARAPAPRVLSTRLRAPTIARARPHSSHASALEPTLAAACRRLLHSAKYACSDDTLLLLLFLLRSANCRITS